MPSETASNGPFVRDHIDVKRSMIFVVIALLPCLLFGIYNVGLQGAGALASEKSFFELFLSGAIAVVPMYAVVFTVGGLCEGLFAVVRKHEINEGFLVTGMLIPSNNASDTSIVDACCCTLFGIIIGKEIFGGTGYNIFNPALTARAFVFFAYPTTMSGDKVWALEGMSGATPLLKVASQSGNNPQMLLGDYSWMDMFWASFLVQLEKHPTLLFDWSYISNNYRDRFLANNVRCYDRYDVDDINYESIWSAYWKY